MTANRRKYFGEVDASAEDVDLLSEYFVFSELSKELIDPKVTDAPCVIVGVKGAGKTALGRVVAQRFKGFTWYRDTDSVGFRFQVPKDPQRSGSLKNILRLFLIEQLAEQLVREKHIQRSKFYASTSKLKSFGVKLSKATKINAVFIKFDPEEFFKIDEQQQIDDTWEKVSDLLGTSLGRKRCFFLLDDIDEYFSGVENSPRFIEGLCRAVIDINRLLKPQVSCLLLMKQGVWRTLYSKPEEYDKIKSDLDFLRWNIDSCAAVLAGRIARIHGLKYEKLTFLDKVPSLDEALNILGKEFKGGRPTVRNCFQEIFSYSTNGPRDVLDLCNKIHFKYPKDKICSDYVSACLPSYSEEKLNGLHADYGHLYPDLSQFVQRVFSDAKSRMAGKALAASIDQEILIKGDSDKEQFSTHSWYTNNAEWMVKMLFDVGVIGFSRPNCPTIFSNEDDSFSKNALLNGIVEVHKAFRPALGLST